MNDSKVLVYDGSFNGFLTAIFVGINEKIEIVGFQKTSSPQKGLFTETKIINTHISKAKKVWNSIEKKNGTILKNVYFAFLSEAEGIEFMLYKYIQKLYALLEPIELEQLAAIELKIVQLAKNVGKEKQLTEVSVDFNVTNDNVYVAEIEPAFNVLPLVSRHFRLRYPKQQWIVFDRKRNYGMYYNLVSVEIIDLETKTWYLNSNTLNHAFSQTDYRLAI